MVKRSVEYWILCDECTQPLDNYNLFKNFLPLKEDSKENIIDVAIQHGWEIKEDKHLCEKCVTQKSKKL